VEHRVRGFSISCALASLLIAASCYGQTLEHLSAVPSWETGPTGSTISFRGIAALNTKTVWLSGAKGTVLKSADGGSTWKDVSPQGFAEIDFRCICLLSQQVAIIASAGSPAVLLRTTNAGKSWTQVYRNDSSQAFFDSMRFWDAEKGIALSDPVDGRLLIVETANSGRSWEQIAPELLPKSGSGEAAFAASNRSIALGEDGQLWIGTGGTDSTKCRVYYRGGWGQSFELQTVPLTSSPTQGIFALEYHESKQTNLLVAVGGDYRQNEPGLENQFMANTCLFSRDAGHSWLSPSKPPGVYQSSVVATKASSGKPVYISTGPIRSHIAYDANHWIPFPGGFHALATQENAVFACGSNGRFARLVWNED